MKLYFYIITVLILFSCNNEDESDYIIEENTEKPQSSIILENFELENYKWLVGKWRDTTSSEKEQVHEIWNYSEDSIYGNGFYVRNNSDTTTPDQSVLKFKNGYFYLINTAKDNSVEFRLTDFSEDSLLFKNPAHRYPQEVSYKKLSDDFFQIRLFGFIHQQNREVIFRMERYE